ncbi:hypothetical protein HYY70_05130 [Candidatus Woesearchaeota archaeon]|nr:hypothetical protein [Candidatus Woesearchaeota archaeon]
MCNIKKYLPTERQAMDITLGVVSSILTGVAIIIVYEKPPKQEIQNTALIMVILGVIVMILLFVAVTFIKFLNKSFKQKK